MTSTDIKWNIGLLKIRRIFVITMCNNRIERTTFIKNLFGGVYEVRINVGAIDYIGCV